MHSRFSMLSARRSAIAFLAAAGTVVGTGVTAGTAAAAPRHDDGLTINATPNPILSGEGVLIYGQLNGASAADQSIRLYHRIDPGARFTLVGTTTTDAQGFYEFTRAEGVVLTNRNWFVRGPDGSHSRTVHERVSALVSLQSDTSSALTGQRVVFSGAISPTHPFERVLLQQQRATNGEGWRTIGSSYTSSGSVFHLSHAWAHPGDYTVRAVFAGDRRNIAGSSDSLTITVQQREHPAFTIASSEPVIDAGQPVTISGTLDHAGTTTAQSGAKVTLFGRGANGGFVALASTTTGANGSYSFTQSPSHNTVYRVALAANPHRVTAPLYEGVRDVLTISAGSATAEQGGTVTFTGTVTPDKAGHEITLQRLASDGRWHDVVYGMVGAGSSYSLTYRFDQPGTVQLRARMSGGPYNVGGASVAQTVIVSGTAPASSLPSSS